MNLASQNPTGLSAKSRRSLALLGACAAAPLLLGAKLASAASGYVQTNLVASDSSIPAASPPDANLINPWGLAWNPSGALWVAENNSGNAEAITQAGVPVLTVAIPFTAASGANPTGQVFSGGSDFVVSSGGKSGPARFIFDGEDGTLSAWSPSVSLNNAVIEQNLGNAAVYKGLAIGASSAGDTLYAANFRAGTVDSYNSSFAPTTLTGTFIDNQIPTGYAPFNVQNLAGKIYVTYAVQNTAKHDDVAGAGNGFVDVYDQNGVLLNRLIQHGELNSPWGLALAPSNFGAFSNDLLVGNFGDGKINAFNPNNGAFAGSLTDAAGNPILLNDLWGISFGVTPASQDTLFTSSGVLNESQGLIASINAVPLPSSLYLTPVGLAAAYLFARKRQLPVSCKVAESGLNEDAR